MPFPCLTSQHEGLSHELDQSSEGVSAVLAVVMRGGRALVHPLHPERVSVTREHSEIGKQTQRDPKQGKGLHGPEMVQTCKAAIVAKTQEWDLVWKRPKQQRLQLQQIKSSQSLGIKGLEVVQMVWATKIGLVG